MLNLHTSFDNKHFALDHFVNEFCLSSIFIIFLEWKLKYFKHLKLYISLRANWKSAGFCSKIICLSELRQIKEAGNFKKYSKTFFVMKTFI